MLEGSVEDYANAPEDKSVKPAVVGQKMAETLNLHAGDTFRIITTKTANGKVSPKLTSFKVCAIVTSGYQDLMHSGYLFQLNMLIRIFPLILPTIRLS